MNTATKDAAEFVKLYQENLDAQGPYIYYGRAAMTKALTHIQNLLVEVARLGKKNADKRAEFNRMENAWRKNDFELRHEIFILSKRAES